MKFQEIMHESDPTDTNLVAYVKKQTYSNDTLKIETQWITHFGL